MVFKNLNIIHRELLVIEGAAFAEIIGLAKEFSFAICHDNAYGAISFDGRINPSFLQYDGAKETGVEVLSFSKIFNMAVWRVIQIS